MKRNLLTFVLLIAVTLLACISTFSSLNNSFSLGRIMLNFAVNLPVCLLIGYVDYRIVEMLHHKIKKTGVWSILATLMLSNILIALLSELLNLLTTDGYCFIRQFLPLFLWNTLIVLIIELLFYNRMYTTNKVRLAMMEKEKAQYQFETLKNQINPHFLFNSLNVLASLTWQDADKANRFTKRLSSVYRYLLTTQHSMKVPLQDELDFVEAYIYLEQIRFGDTLHIHVEYCREALSKYIIPASIQLLVENALKHNINTLKSPLNISIVIDKDYVTVTNNLQTRGSTTKSRIGLSNLKKQYGMQGLQIEIIHNERYFTVRLPLLSI